MIQFFFKESSSRHLLVALENLLKRSHHRFTSIAKRRYQSKSVNDLLIYRRNSNEQNVSHTTRTELDLSDIGCEQNETNNDLPIQRSRSAPISPTKIYEQELAGFIHGEDQHYDSFTDHFIFNIDLSHSNETTTETFFVSNS